MKKNLITVIILAICIINLVFNIILMFVFLPSAKKTNNLITDIAAVLDLELAGSSSFDVSNLVAVQLESDIINLASDGSDASHYVKYELTINLDSKVSDYTKVSENIAASNSIIYDTTRDIVAQYTYEQVKDVEVQRKIKEDILVALKETFNTECIYSISFNSWVAQ